MLRSLLKKENQPRISTFESTFFGPGTPLVVQALRHRCFSTTVPGDLPVRQRQGVRGKSPYCRALVWLVLSAQRAGWFVFSGTLHILGSWPTHACNKRLQPRRRSSHCATTALRST